MEAKALSIKGNIKGVTKGYSCTISRRVTALDTVLHPALLMRSTGERLALGGSIVQAAALLLAGATGIKLLSLFVVSALVHTATFFKMDALIPTEHESRITKASFSTWCIAWCATLYGGGAVLACAWTTASTDLIVGIGLTGKSWK